jgi:hypothetical protein
MYRGESGAPPYRLECDHDFNVIIVFEQVPDDPSEQETYMVMRVWVNDWNVISREVKL